MFRENPSRPSEHGPLRRRSSDRRASGAALNSLRRFPRAARDNLPRAGPPRPGGPRKPALEPPLPPSSAAEAQDASFSRAPPPLAVEAWLLLPLIVDLVAVQAGGAVQSARERNSQAMNLQQRKGRVGFVLWLRAKRGSGTLLVRVAQASMLLAGRG